MPAPIAIVRRPSPAIADGEVTHIDRVPMDVDRALAQHQAYLDLLQRHGYALEFVADAPQHPDGIFVEDTLVMAGGLAIITRPGADSRRGEIDSTRATVHSLGLAMAAISAPATLDGGDVLVVGRHVFIGRTTRTNDDGIAQFAELMNPFGISVVPVDVPGCLHLKSAITALPDGSLLAVPSWVDRTVFEDEGFVVHDAMDLSGGDVLCLGNTVILPHSASQTAEFVSSLGFPVETIDVGELEKIECGVTCMSVLVPT